MDTTTSRESGLTEDNSASKQSSVVVQPLPQHNELSEHQLCLHDEGTGSTNIKIPIQIQQIRQELNKNVDNSSKYFSNSDKKNQIAQNGAVASSSVSVISSSKDVSLLGDEKSSKVVSGHRQYSIHIDSEKVDTCQSADTHRSLCSSEDNSNGCNAGSEKFIVTGNLLSDSYNNSSEPSYNQSTHVLQNAPEYLLIEGHNENYLTGQHLIRNDMCEAGKDYGILGNNIKKCNTFVINTEELDTSAVVDVVEETIVTTESEHICTYKEGSSLSSYICGSCKAEFFTICKLHDHFENQHFTGTYIFNQSTRMGFPRLENVCKLTQTNVAELLESDQTQFKNDEADDTDEYDLESGMDILEKNIKIDGTVSNDNNVAEHTETVMTKSDKDRRKRKKEKHERGTKDDETVSLNEDGTTRLKKITKTRNRQYKKSNRHPRLSENAKNAECVNQSAEADEEHDCDIENVENQSDHSVSADTASSKVALKNEYSPNDTVCMSEKFTSLNDSGNHSFTKCREKILPSKLKLKENRISKSMIQENKNDNLGSYNCAICATKYITKRKLRYHMTKVHKTGNTDCQKQCRWCGLSFPGSQSFSAHVRQCEKNENLMCLICNKKFDTRPEVADHLISHRNDRDLKCRLCERTFTCEVALQSHLRRHNLRKDLQCEHCGKAFYYHNLLKKHKLYCNREPDIACSHCPLKFKTPDSLKHHMSVHSSERPFVCHVCGYAAKKSMYLKRHLRCHTGEKPYVCSECGMSFAAANGLNRHRKTHTNDKPCVCHYCGKSFTNNWNLKTHLRQHTGDTPYRCGQCGKAFKQNVLLKLHTKSHHSAETMLLQ